MGILKNAKIKMNLKKKREQENALQVKKKSIALKGTQEDSSSEKSTNEDDDELAIAIKKANKMMRKKFYKKKGARKPNFKKNESVSSNCFECNKPRHIKKDCPMLKEKYKRFKKKTALDVG